MNSPLADPNYPVLPYSYTPNLSGLRRQSSFQSAFRRYLTALARKAYGVRAV